MKLSRRSLPTEREAVAEEDGTGLARLIRGSALIARSTDAARTYYHYASDEMGSITHIVDEAGAVQNRYEYDAWGNLTVQEEAVPNRFKYTGQQLDPITQQSQDPYLGVKQASEYLKGQGVGRKYRKQILESFDVRTINIKIADDSTYGLRFYGGNANAEGRYLFETFTPEINRENLALPHEWNSMTGIRQFQINPGTIIIAGRAAPQLEYGSQYVGGANQWYIKWYINSLEDLI